MGAIFMASDINRREAPANKYPTGDHAPQGSSVAAIRQPSIKNPLTRIVNITARMSEASAL